MKRQNVAEWLDDDLGSAGQIAASLDDLRHINQWFGGIGTSLQMVRRVLETSGSRKLSLLEVGAGAGDVPLTVQRKLASEGVDLGVTLLDRVASHLPTEYGSVAAGDAMRLPFRENSFDVVSCCLLAHHFEADELRRYAEEALRVARRAVIINDLRRSASHLAFVYLGLPLFRSRITWHDAPASVCRAYTLGEMRQILSSVGARRVDISRHYLFRMGVLLWK